MANKPSILNKPFNTRIAHMICRIYGELDCSVLYAAPHRDGDTVKVIIKWETGRIEFYNVREVIEYVLTNYR